MSSKGLFINGQFVKADSSRTLDTLNPATGEILASVPVANREDVNKAVESASIGFHQWRKMPLNQRSSILLDAARRLREENSELAELEVADTGKPLREAVSVDVLSGAEVIEYYAKLASTLCGVHQPLDEASFFYTRREPLGVCAGIGAWNYPLQIACWKSGLALACGNTMVYKPSEETPLTTLRLAQIYHEAGVPPGVFNVVTGDGTTGAALAEHPDVAKVSFTGSTHTGTSVLRSAAETIKEVTLELGGKSPLIVFDDCDINSAVNGAMLANFYTQGEVCTNGTRVYVQRSIYEEFLQRLVGATQKLIIGSPMDMATHVGSLISERHLKKVLGYIETAKNSGARLLCGGTRVQDGDLAKGFFVKPTIFSDCTEDMPHTQDEIFGPVMSVLVFDHEDEVITRANRTRFGLAAGVFTQQLAKAHRVIAQLEAGICWVNTYGASPAEMPVGGYKQSGIGRENGIESMHHYTQTKSVFVELNPLNNPFD